MTRLIALLLLAGLAIPARASAESPYDVYRELASRKLNPSPLVFTAIPKRLQPLGSSLSTLGTQRGYGLRLSDENGAVIALEGGTYRNRAAALKDFKRLGYKRTATKIRGHKGEVLRRNSTIALTWTENGTIYFLGTGTPRTIPLAALRQTANRLERLGIARWGITGEVTSDSDDQTSVFAVTTEKTITGRIEWGAPCRYAGFQDFLLHPLEGKSFSLPLADDEWTGTMTGTVGPTSITVTVHVTRPPFEGVSCDSGVRTFTLDRTEG